MITHIRIKDFAIIDQLEIDFQKGLNIVTGETGSGKSIIIEAVSLALGSRADTAFVRSGKEKAVVQMVAELDGEEYIVTREISANGKNICKVNDEIVTLSNLSKLCKKLADVHGQYDHQSLLNPDNHLKLVDSYQEDVISPIRETVTSLYTNYARIKQELSSLISNQADAERKRDFMRFELQEIASAKPIAGEDEELAQKLNLLQNSEKIYQNLSEIYEIMYESAPSALEGMGRSLHLLEEMESYSQDIKSFSEELSDAYYKLEDLTSEIRRFRDNISFSPEILEETIARLNILDSLKRKYGGTIENVLAYQEKISADVNKMENIEQVIESLKKELSGCEKELLCASQDLSKCRRHSAKEIENRINDELTELNFKNAVLSIDFGNIEENTAPIFSPDGIDKVEFLITTNKGETPKPLVKIASGGEISRIMLAFKRIVGDYDAIPTMIFDEIDTGISGVTASIIGKKLLEISNKHQIICITHLPQIAAFGDHHLKIDKEISEDTTHTTVKPLTREDQILEIARLLGGINITDITKKSAEELIRLSHSAK